MGANIGPSTRKGNLLRERKKKMLRNAEEIIMVLRDGKEGAEIPRGRERQK